MWMTRSSPNSVPHYSDSQSGDITHRIQRSDLVEVELPKAQPEKRQESKQPKGKRAKLEKSAKGMKTMTCFFKPK